MSHRYISSWLLRFTPTLTSPRTRMRRGTISQRIHTWDKESPCSFILVLWLESLWHSEDLDPMSHPRLYQWVEKKTKISSKVVGDPFFHFSVLNDSCCRVTSLPVKSVPGWVLEFSRINLTDPLFFDSCVRQDILFVGRPIGSTILGYPGSRLIGTSSKFRNEV